MSNNELNVSVRIVYYGLKGAAVVQSDFKGALAILQVDLTTLGINPPKAENVKVLYSGCLQFVQRTSIGSVSS
jgi:hypothetical protein